MDCSPDALSQNIRLVCNTADERSEHCQNLFEGVGPEGKLVRLPENVSVHFILLDLFVEFKHRFGCCSVVPVPLPVLKDLGFPKINHFPQRSPSALFVVKVKPPRSGRLQSTRISLPSIPRMPCLSAIQCHPNDVFSAGPVNIAIRGANVPGAGAEIVPDPAVVQARSHPRQFNKRFFGQFVRDAIDAITGLNTFDVNQSSDLPSLDINENFNLFQASFGCDPVEANVSVDVRAKARAAANIGIAGTGTIIPPDFSDIGIVIGNIDLFMLPYVRY